MNIAITILAGHSGPNIDVQGKTKRQKNDFHNEDQKRSTLCVCARNFFLYCPYFSKLKFSSIVRLCGYLCVCVCPARIFCLTAVFWWTSASRRGHAVLCPSASWPIFGHLFHQDTNPKSNRKWSVKQGMGPRCAWPNRASWPGWLTDESKRVSGRERERQSCMWWDSDQEKEENQSIDRPLPTTPPPPLPPTTPQAAANKESNGERRHKTGTGNKPKVIEKAVGRERESAIRTSLLLRRTR